MALRRTLTGLRTPASRAVVASVCLLAAACSRKAAEDAARAGAVVQPAAVDPVQATLLGVMSTSRLASSTLETRQAAPGDRFVVLDVSAHNGDRQPQVFSEGRLVNVDEHSERSFATPVSMLADEFLTLQVLAPAASVRGKIAWEVPSDLRGVWYWVPGNGRKRILLHVDAPARVVTTSANAEAADVDRSAAATPASTPTQQSVAPHAQQPDARIVATLPARTTHDLQADAGPEAAIAHSGGGDEQARTLACRSLMARNDPGEKARYLGFFSRECGDQAMPSAWIDGDVASSSPRGPGDTPRWPPRPGPAFDCNEAYTRAEHLVCQDAVLSLMDWELNRAYAQASRVVDDPDGLRRDEDAWRHRVRDACDSSRCVESVYDRRTAQLQALADQQR